MAQLIGFSMKHNVSRPVPRNANGPIGQHRIVVCYIEVRPLQRNGGADIQQPCQALDHLARIDRIVLGERVQSQLGDAAIVQISFDVLVSGYEVCLIKL